MSGALEPAGWGPREVKQRLPAAARWPISGALCGDVAVSLPALLSPAAPKLPC